MRLIVGPVAAEMPQPFAWTRDAYHCAADTGVFDGQRVELIGGEIVVMAPQRDPHAHTATILEPGETVSPLAAPRTRNRVADLLP